MPDTPLNPDALKTGLEAGHHAYAVGGDQLDVSRAAIAAYLAAALPEVTNVEELDQLPVGAVVYAANHIGPAERFTVGWMGCGNAAAWSSALLARDGLPARVLHVPEVTL